MLYIFENTVELSFKPKRNGILVFVFKCVFIWTIIQSAFYLVCFNKILLVIQCIIPRSSLYTTFQYYITRIYKLQVM